MSSRPRRSLLDRRLIIVTGKGGTGKTTVVASLALAAAHARKRVLIAETGPDEHIPRLLASHSGEVGYEGKELLPGIRVMRVDPYAALMEYLGSHMGVRVPLRFMIRNKAFHQFMDATPGWRELITLGKIWQLEGLRDENDQPLYDLILVDAPATGHGLTFLEVPHVVASAVRSGPLHRNSELVEALMTDEERTLLLPVALAEELPARETVELVDRVRDHIRVPIDRVIVNSVMPPPFPAGLENLDSILARLPGETKLRGVPKFEILALCAAHLRSRYELNQHYTTTIEEETGLPVVTLPHIAHGIASLSDLRKLAGSLGRRGKKVEMQ